MVKKGIAFGFFHRCSGIQSVGNFMEGQHALDDDAGRRYMLCWNPFSQHLRQSLIYLEKCFLGSALITIVELFTGIIVNLWMHWHVWDYSSQWMNFLGQVCPLFSFFWFVLTFPLLFLSNQINRFFQSHSLELKLR